MRSRGSALLVGLLLVVALSLLGLSLVLTGSLGRAGSDPLRLKGLLSAEGALVLSAATASSPAAGGPRLFRDLALPVAGSPRPLWRGSPAESAARGLVPQARLFAPAFAGLSRDDGSDLKATAQQLFAAESYRLEAESGPAGPAARRMTGVLDLPAVPLDVRRLPEPP
ncbi:hypothetical protein FBQ97_13045 [Acidobacteria bacterium ACD]|nr:MAG: hypothetical protein EDX89_22780 [Acidobacteriota bacterium]MDL1950723.1 hypothetical protein [Acidobacteria bacterium ACD]